jgi:hypothetical protein
VALNRFVRDLFPSSFYDLEGPNLIPGDCGIKAGQEGEGKIEVEEERDEGEEDEGEGE